MGNFRATESTKIDPLRSRKFWCFLDRLGLAFRLCVAELRSEASGRRYGRFAFPISAYIPPPRIFGRKFSDRPYLGPYCSDFDSKAHKRKLPASSVGSHTKFRPRNTSWPSKRRFEFRPISPSQIGLWAPWRPRVCSQARFDRQIGLFSLRRPRKHAPSL